ncbi:hypothetical protein ABB37_03320 [Leptomonas pyrrhocoris]|uniref:Uncharacterized protein n=1 Tax=Leptomonas pyrrhocoris TaxID=157538 RepID=A0A0N0VG38_LEPPY|nr:hypothetical protein ABB37_03320 [Leptomonas pyrrhocoris]KPA82198.1 hypothetical protein ABB37_03320 [Leptomonas pyrrhocoris]|eukprot:XP_015660637.1 hypothetical protein ABB37_03320 [Leptomonas pyrrhocoris]
MYHRSLAKLGVFSVLVEELKKVPAYFSHKTQEGAKAYVESASQTLEFLKGEDPSESPEMREKRRQHKKMYQAILKEQAINAAQEKAKAQQALAQLPWRQRLALRLQEAKEALQQMTCTKAGVMAVLQHCTASHAAEVALEQGIDVKDVQMVLEKAAAANSVGYENVVVGYIDAPNASREEVMAFAEKLHKACPVAHSMHIEWRQGRPSARDALNAHAMQGEIDRAARQVEWEEKRAAASPSAAAADTAIPIGMPGSRRVYSSSSRSANRGAGDDVFHLPGVNAKKDTAADREQNGLGSKGDTDSEGMASKEALNSSVSDSDNSKAPQSRHDVAATQTSSSSPVTPEPPKSTQDTSKPQS